MGEDLILVVLEIEKGKKPAWNKAKEALVAIPLDEIGKVVSEVAIGADAWKNLTPEDQESYRSAAQHGLDQLEAAWYGQHRYGVSTSLTKTDVLIMGGGSWGDDPFEGYSDVTLAIELGLAGAAGFLNG